MQKVKNTRVMDMTEGSAAKLLFAFRFFWGICFSSFIIWQTLPLPVICWEMERLHRLVRQQRFTAQLQDLPLA